MMKKNNDRILSFISLTAKAGKLVSGEFATENAVKNRKAHLVIIAEDASDNTKKHFMDMCAFRDIPYAVYGTKDDLGRVCGKDQRSNLAICDTGFSENIKRLLAEVE